MKHLAMLTAAILMTAASFYVAWLLWDVFVLFFVSVALAAALRPLVIQMRGWNLSDSTAILICYAALLLLLALLVFIYSGLVGNELNIVLDRFPVWYDGLRQRFAAGASWQQSITGFLPSSEVLIRAIANFGIGGGSTTLLNLSSGVLNGFIFIIGVLSLGYYWLVDQNRFERLWLSLLPVPARVRARGIWRGAENEIGTYVRVELAIVVTVSLFLLGIYTLIGLPFAALLSLMSGLVQLLPWLGGSLMLVVTFAVALSTGNIVTALVVLAVGLAQEPILAYLLRPYMYRNAKKLNSLLVVVMLLTLGSLGGLTAALLAQPVAVLLQVFYQNIVLDPQRVARTDALPELQRLSERTDALEVALQEDDESNPALRNLVMRVRSLVNRTRDVVTVSEEQTVV
jgi:predicted PurR-regulated permease PerM